MITFINKVIKEKIPTVTGDLALTYLKLCTPTSGKTLKDKVIFLVFKNNESEPFLCVKTVRNYGAKEVIAENFKNLQKLHLIVQHSRFAEMFATPLHVHDDGEQIFSIETACKGFRMAPTDENFNQVMNQYVALQKDIKEKNSGLIDIPTYAKKIISEVGLEAVDQEELNRYIDNLHIQTKVPRIAQHGDLTFDNILMSSQGLRIVDYDFANVTELPGFDIFGFSKRFYKKNVTLEKCKTHIRKYFAELNVVMDEHNVHGLCFLYHLIEYIKRKPSGAGNLTAKKIIADFESM